MKTGTSMIVYVVQEGDTIASIADRFGISESRLILENGIKSTTKLVIGQTIVITYPQEIYTVQEGDTLPEIAELYGVTIMQLYRNNPFLWENAELFLGEELVIRYNTKGSTVTNAYAFPFIDRDILKKALPSLTYLSILNYKTMRRGEIEAFYDDFELVRMARLFGVLPIMLITSVSFQGERNPEIVYEILLNPEYQERHVQNMVKVMKEKGYSGANITITYLNEANQELYLNYLTKVTSIIKQAGYLVFITIDPNFVMEDNQVTFEKADYSKYNDLIDEAYLMKFYWGRLYEPPMPVSSIENITLYLDYMIQMIDRNKINIGFPLLGYDWTLPYIRGISETNAITLDNAMDLARIHNAVIQFDEVSQTPYFYYQTDLGKRIVEHVVWFVDARTIEAIIDLVLENGLRGTGLWNIMTYYPQLWLMLNSSFTVIKYLPEIY